jgi:lipopolysaccharide export system protein LptA
MKMLSKFTRRGRFGEDQALSRGLVPTTPFPSPQPSPRGEGATTAAEQPGRRTAAIDRIQHGKTPTAILPLPGGEGRGEGEDNSRILTPGSKSDSRPAAFGGRIAVAVLTGLLLLTTFAFAATPNTSASITSSNNNLLIVCTNGGDFSASSAVFRGAVQVAEPQMYLECELLTVTFQTNTQSRAEVGSLTNVNARIETIVAETNLLMMARDTTIIGDRAVYTASNEVVVVTGTLVVIETEKSYTYGEHFIFDRRTGKGRAIGWNVTELKMEGTNSFKSTLSPLQRQPRTSPPKTNGSK